MSIDPKWGIMASILASVLGILSAAKGVYPSYFTPAVIEGIRTTAAFMLPIVTTVIGVLFGYSSDKPGPLVSKPLVPPTAAILALIGIGMGGILMSGGHAEAKPLPRVHHVVSAPVKELPNIQQLFTNLQTITIQDLQTADLDAQAQGDRVADQCYVAILTVVSAQKSIDTTDLPKVHLFTTFQQFRDFVVSLRVGSPLKTACAPLADEMKTDVTTLVTQITAGTVSWATVAPLFGL